MEKALNGVVPGRAASDEVELMDLRVLPGAGAGHPAPAADPVANLTGWQRQTIGFMQPPTAWSRNFRRTGTQVV